MKKILVTRKLLRSCEEKASKIFNTHGKTSSFMQYTFPLVESRSPQIFELPIDQRIKDISIKLLKGLNNI